ncbi:galactose oxidase-like domain-containing protein [Streptomyces sp. NPDC020362]
MSSWVYVGGGSGPNGTGGAAQVLAVHAALLPVGQQGRVLYFSGSQWVEAPVWEAIENEPNPVADSRYPAGKAQIDHTRLYDCATRQVSNPGSPDADLFCSGHAFRPDGRLVVAGGTQHWPDPAEGDPHHAHWSGTRASWLFDHTAQFRARPGAAVTALWHGDRHLDLFATGTDGAVWSAWWEPGTGWVPWFQIQPRVRMQPGATVTALWRNAGHLDLLATGTDGAVWSTWWEAGPGWQPWFLVRPEVRMQPGATVTALWHGDQHLDLFATGTDGAVWSTWWDPAGGWRPWFLIHPEVKMRPGATVTALWRNADHLDLFVTGTDGAVWSAWWEPGPGWQRWFLIHPEVKMQPGATVTALWRNGDHLDLFATGTDGAVWSAWWEPGPGWQRWFLIHPEVKMRPGATVTALWRNAGHLDLFAMGTDGAVWSAWWEPGPGWQPWFLVHPEVRMQPGATVTALWHGDQHLDLFATGTDGAVWSTWWEPGPGWQAWFLILNGQFWVYAGSLSRDPAQRGAGAPMGGGRWYPTLVTLADGGVLALTGHPLIGQYGDRYYDYDERHNNTKPEIHHQQSNSWQGVDKQLGVSGAHDYAVYYPRLHVLPHTGEVFVVQPLYSRLVTTNPQSGNLYSANPDDTSPPYAVDVMDKSLCYDAGARQVTRAFTGPQAIDGMYLDRFFTSQPTTSVLLPLHHEENYRPRVLACGAQQAVVTDLGAADPHWAPTAARALTDPASGRPPVRHFCTATLLPTGDVLVSGGVTKEVYKETDGVRTAELYHPSASGGSWSTGAVAAETRGYHSVALLTPDGRVWTAGSEFNDTSTPNLSIELFEPDYVAVADRVTIRSAPGAVGYGRTFRVDYTPTSTGTPIARVVLMRCGSVTHSFDGDQRYVSVPFTGAGSSLTVTAPPDGTVAPPGFYMLWLVDSNGLPCRTAPFIRLG